MNNSKEKKKYHSCRYGEYPTYQTHAPKVMTLIFFTGISDLQSQRKPIVVCFILHAISKQLLQLITDIKEMDSEESRPGSSASNSSSSSVESNENIENGSVSSSHKSRSKSVNSNSSSASSSREHSPESQNAVLKEPQSPMQDSEQDNDSQSRSVSRASNRSDVSNNTSEGRENGSVNSRQSSEQPNQNYSREQSVSPTRGSRSRNSSVSSVPDATNVEQLRNDAINISHEDLSDVSDLDSAAASPMNDRVDVRKLQIFWFCVCIVVIYVEFYL